MNNNPGKSDCCNATFKIRWTHNGDRRICDNCKDDCNVSDKVECEYCHGTGDNKRPNGEILPCICISRKQREPQSDMSIWEAEALLEEWKEASTDSYNIRMNRVCTIDEVNKLLQAQRMVHILILVKLEIPNPNASPEITSRNGILKEARYRILGKL